ncbi:MAG: sigma-E processing peptidase SpoIIGA [Anaerovoracaceae bacterium]
MVIYAEYLFIENLITGGLILTLTGRISGIRVKRIPLVLGSILCGIYSFILFWDHLLPQIAIFSKVAFSVLVVLLVFPTKKIKRLARTILIFYIISLALGGITIGAAYFTKAPAVTQNSAIYLEKFSYISIVLGCLLTYLFFNSLARFIKTRFFRQKTTADVLIKFENKTTRLKGLVDTGNALTDPITGKPVFIMSLSAAKKVLPAECMNLISCGMNEKSIYETLIKSSLADRIRLIPFKAIGEQTGILLGIRPDKISLEIHEEQGAVESIVMPEGIIVAINRGKFSTEDSEEGYSILLHPSAMEGGIAFNV